MVEHLTSRVPALTSKTKQNSTCLEKRKRNFSWKYFDSSSNRKYSNTWIKLGLNRRFAFHLGFPARLTKLTVRTLIDKLMRKGKAQDASALDNCGQLRCWEWGKSSSLGKSHTDYPLSEGQLWKHKHTSDIIQTKQVVFMHLGIHTYTCTNTHK